MSVEHAIANTSTYIQGGLEISTSTSGGSTKVTAKFYMRRTNTYTGATSSSSVTSKITIDGTATQQTAALTVAGGKQNQWQGPYLTATKTFTGNAKEITISWSTTDNAAVGTSLLAGSGSTKFTVPASVVAPTTPTVSAAADSYNSISITYGTASFGIPSSGTVYLYGGTSDSPTSQLSSKTSTGSSKYTHSSLTPNTKYYYRARAYNGSAYSSYTDDVSAITPCRLSSISCSSQSYATATTSKATIAWARASDGGALARTAYYRISTDGGSTYGGWVSLGTVTAGSGTFNITVATSKSVKVQMKLSTTAGDSAALETSFSSLSTHTAPSFSNFTYADTNSSTVALTGNNQTLIQGQSIPKVTISTANKAVGKDGVAVASYSAALSQASETVAYSSNSAVAMTLDPPHESGTLNLRVAAHDNLSLSTTVSKSVTIYPWSEPTIKASATRTNNFQAETTLKISGEWAPITISGANKNSLTVSYRYKQSNTSTWSAWEDRPVTISDKAWSTVNLVKTFDNTMQWDIEVRATDAFSTTTVSLVLTVGQPLFYIGTDGRVVVGGMPTLSLASSKQGQLEVLGNAYANGNRLAEIPITSSSLGDLAVTSDKIANGAVTGAANNATAVGSTKLALSTIGTPNLRDGAVTSNKIDFTTLEEIDLNSYFTVSITSITRAKLVKFGKIAFIDICFSPAKTGTGTVLTSALLKVPFTTELACHIVESNAVRRAVLSQNGALDIANYTASFITVFGMVILA